MVVRVWLTLQAANQGFPGGARGKDPACQCRRCKRRGFNSWVRKVPGGGHGNPLQDSCLENALDRGVRQAAVPGVTKSQTRLKRLSTQAADSYLASGGTQHSLGEDNGTPLQYSCLENPMNGGAW